MPTPKRSSVFQRALLREFGNLVVAVFAILFAITLTSLLVRVLGRAAGGKIPAEAVLAIIGFTALNWLPMLLAISVFVSVLIALARSYRDSEMVVWFASGVPLSGFVRPVLVFTLPFVVVTAVLAFFLSPWAVANRETYQRQLAAQEEVSRIAPGVFLESSKGDRVFFMEADPTDPTHVRNIFVSFRQHGRLGVMVSERGYIDTQPNGERFAVLLNGRRYEGTPGTPEYRIMDFERYAVRIQARAADRGELHSKARPTAELVTDSRPESRGELVGRIGVPLTALILPLLAIPLAFVNPRASRSLNVIFAVLTYMVYNNVLATVEVWVRHGKLSFAVGWWIVHAGMLLLLAVMFYWRVALRPIPQFRR